MDTIDPLEELSKKSSVIIIGPPMTGKSLFALRLLIDGLSRGEGVICLLTNTFPEDFLGDVKIPEEKKGLVKFIDCYTKYTGIPAQDTPMVYRVSSPVNLNEMSLGITKTITELRNKTKEKRIKIIANSLSTLLTYNTLERITSFLQVIIGKVKSIKGASFFIVEEGMHDQKHITAITALIDTIAKLEIIDDERYIRIIDVGEKKEPIKYKIKDKHIIIGE